MHHKKKKHKTKVIHIQDSYKHRDTVYIGRPTKWGIPFAVYKDDDIDEVIAKYRKWFKQRLMNTKFKKDTLELKGKVLTCYCRRKRCHGDVIVEWLEGE